MQLNVRACLAVLRGAGIQVADTRWEDLEDAGAEKGSPDWRILDRAEDSVRGWIALRADGELEIANLNTSKTASGGSSDMARIQSSVVSGGKN